MKVVPVLGLTAALIGSSTSMAHAVNLVTNGGFETGDFTGYTLSGNVDVGNTVYVTGDPSLVHSGTYAAGLGPIGSLGFLSQTLATIPAQTYELSYFLQSDGLTPNEFQTIVGGTTLFDQTNIPAQPYTQYTFDFVASSASTDLTFGSQNDPSYFYLDDVSVTSASSVPEPSSMSGVLVFGALGIGFLLKRQRKQKSTQITNQSANYSTEPMTIL